MGPIPGRGTWEGFATDIGWLCGLIIVVALLDAIWEAFGRWRGGGDFLRREDLRSRLFVWIYLPFILSVATWEHAFGFHGFGLFDDDPYFLAVLVALALITWCLVAWAKRRT